MWLYVQMWFPLLTVALTAAICLSVVSFIMGAAEISSIRARYGDQRIERAYAFCPHHKLFEFHQCSARGNISRSYRALIISTTCSVGLKIFCVS